MTGADEKRAHRRGPRREEGAPSGPEEVRRAVLDAAAVLFAERGLDRVSLRDIADAANIHPALIGRYLGSRDDLVMAVFDDLSVQLASALSDNPLEGQGFGNDTVMGQWTQLVGALAINGQPIPALAGFNPVTALADTLVEAYGLDAPAARLRAAQIAGAGLGWRIFEDYLVAAGDLGDVPLETLRDELLRAARRLGSTPWPSASDPTPRPR